jgi:4-amino-4-deoxy-L-arabinose transferase-like glycosyltransferase
VEAGRRSRSDLLWYAGAVVLGGVLMTVTALTQPYNQNEWVQIEPYVSTDPAVITSGTRQPPLDPLLGALVQHLLGEGQLQQRVVPVTSGIASIALVAALLRRVRTGAVGVVAAYLLATMPVFVRYAAYARPYALPLLLMLLCCWAGSRWLDTGRRRWLLGAAAAALLAPAARVPEPVTFLGAALVVLLWLGWRRRLHRHRAWALAAAIGAALVTTGSIMFLALREAAGETLFDPTPSEVAGRLDGAGREVVDFVAPLLADWFPWWPAAVALIVLALVLPQTRHLRREAWFLVPLLAGPVAFFAAFHLVTSARDYRARFAYFLGPPLVLLVAAACVGLTALLAARSRDRARWPSWLGAGLVAALVAVQVPTTLRVLTEDDVPDFAEAGRVVTAQVPADGLVLVDTPASGNWRLPFFGHRRYLDDDSPQVVTVSLLAKGVETVSAAGPVHLLVIDPACATSATCEKRQPAQWDGRIPGYALVRDFDRFRLYRPLEGQAGAAGAITALEQLAESFGPAYAGKDVRARARLLRELRR